MPTAGKVFLYREDLTIKEIHDKIKGHREEVIHEGLQEVTLVTDISDDLQLYEKEIEGVYRYDKVLHFKHRTGPKEIVITVDAPFIFFLEEDQIFLLTLCPKQVSNSTANKFSLLLHEEMGTIVEALMRPSSLEGFYKNSEGTKILLFDNIEIPNMNKATLYGENVVQTSLYGDFIGMGEPWYLVAKTKAGLTIGLVRDGSVVVFSTIETREFIAFIKDDIVPMILQRDRT